jgi:ADP-heptose:LPS heptosyltransferase
LLRQQGLCVGRVINEFLLPQYALDEARKFFTTRGLDVAKPTIFIQPFTSGPNKNWPLDRQIALAGHFQNKGFQILFGGSPAEQGSLGAVRQAGFPVSAGVPLLVSGGLMKLCSVIVGGDTGLLHLAVAMNKRVVMVMRSIVPGTCHPLQHPDWTLTSADGFTILSISTETVIAACGRALAEVKREL